MAQVGIKRAIEWVPGGMMVIPLLIGAMFATFAPGTGDFFGSFTGALFKGALPILAVFYVCMGATIDIRSTPYVLKKLRRQSLLSGRLGRFGLQSSWRGAMARRQSR